MSVRSRSSAGAIVTAGLLMTSCSDLTAADVVKSHSQPTVKVPYSFEPAPPVQEHERMDSVVHSPSDRRGGTLRLASAGEWGSLDPAAMNSAAARNLVRTYGRALVAFRAAPGPAGSELVPDLAESLGVPSDDFRTWTYTLRRGVTYEDGVPITSKDVKYAVSRSLDPSFGSPRHLRDLLDLQGYVSAYSDKSKDRLGLKAIETPDDHTVVFHLNRSYSLFDYVAQLPATIPVPRSRDRGIEYASRVVSSGPYKFEAPATGKRLTLVRNPNYDPATDPMTGRRALPDQITLDMNVGQAALDRDLLAGDIDVDAAAVGLLPEMASKVDSDAAIRARTDVGERPAGTYVVINAEVEPFDKLLCRRAILLGADHEALAKAYGVASPGAVTTSVLPPVVPGAAVIDRYSVRKHVRGNQEAAKAAVEACGILSGVSTRISFDNGSARAGAVAESLRDSLSRVGVLTSLEGFPAKDYYDSYAGNPGFTRTNGIGLIVIDHGALWPEGMSFFERFVDSRLSRSVDRNPNVGVRIDEVDLLLDKARVQPTEAARSAIYREIDSVLMDRAVILPVAVSRASLVHSAHATNVFVNDAFGMYDYTALGTTRR